MRCTEIEGHGQAINISTSFYFHSCSPNLDWVHKSRETAADGKKGVVQFLEDRPGEGEGLCHLLTQPICPSVPTWTSQGTLGKCSRPFFLSLVLVEGATLG